jgi:spore coat polysaccharide biosynthesis protein SpsF
LIQIWLIPEIGSPNETQSAIESTKKFETLMKSPRYLVVLQARMSSNRLPGKVLKSINGQPMIFRQINRVVESTQVEDLIVATSLNSSDDELVKFLESKDVKVFRGSLDNVLSRFLEITKKINPTNVIRLTADCPLVMPKLIDEMIDYFEEKSPDYLSNSLVPTFPDGLDVEIISSEALSRLESLDLSKMELEHVTMGIYNRPDLFKVLNFSNTVNQSNMRWTVDYPEDLDFVRSVYSHFKGQESIFDHQKVLEFLRSNPEVVSGISASRRNEALLKPQDGNN